MLKGKNPTMIGKLGFIFLFILIVAIVLQSLYFNLSHVGAIDFALEEGGARVLETTLQNNLEVFTNRPVLGDDLIGTIHTSGSMFTTENSEILEVYTLLSNHSSWNLNRILLTLLSSGTINMVFVGILIGTKVYSQTGKEEKKYAAKHIMKNQVFSLVIFTLVVMLGVILLGSILSHYYYAQHLNQLEGMQILNDFYDNFQLWTPDIVYTSMSLLGTFIYLFTLGVTGIFIGHIVKNAPFAIVGAIGVSMTWFTYLFLYPISPMFLLARIIGNFILGVGPSVAMISGNMILYLSLLVIFLGIFLFISYKLLNERMESMGS